MISTEIKGKMLGHITLNYNLFFFLILSVGFMCCNILAKVMKWILLNFHCRALAPTEQTFQKGFRASGIQSTFWYVAKEGTISDSDNTENILIESSYNPIKVTILSRFEPEG